MAPPNARAPEALARYMQRAVRAARLVWPMAWLLLTAWLSGGAPCVARADPAVHSYALVVGSNRAGVGQSELQFAVEDAHRMAALLRELGRTPHDQITLLEDPDASAVEHALAQLGDRLRVHAAAGEGAQLMFYYSGHARANALSLGSDELPLARLRASLLALPSTLTVVVLDACQSGAFSGVKGASPAGDFSVQSVQDLHNTGVAVMASSTGSELSQESRELGSSYFSHHLLVSLRGAGDRDRNGRVSLDEAYAYAYQHTLSDTARTQVGSQHATLETALTGRGDVPLSYPVDADAQLALSGPIEGKILVQQSGRGAVMAELIKAPGAPVLLALPSGSYDVLVRGERSARSCRVKLTTGTVAALVPEQCEEVPLPEEAAKLDGLHARQNALGLESWFAELGFSVVLKSVADGYTQRLHTFGFNDNRQPELGVDTAAGWMFSPYVGLIARYGVLSAHDFYRYDPAGNDYQKWRTRAVTVGPRGRYPLLGRWLALYGDVGVGIGFTESLYSYFKPGEPFRQGDFRHHHAVALRAAAGIDAAVRRHFGFYTGVSYGWSPSLENELGDTHGARSWSLQMGIRVNAVTGGW